MKKAIYIIIVLLIIGGVVWLIKTPGKPGKYDQFAQCITSKGVTFWGAFWCPHCQAEKARFGKSQKYLPYKECSTPDGNSQLQVCKDNHINTYPTWDFPAGLNNSTTTTRVTGEIELVDLAKMTGCTLDNAAVTATTQ
jgi:thiol-disulfide isomerase/thioredoxin